MESSPLTEQFLVPSDTISLAHILGSPEAARVAEALQAAPRILVCTHRNPDGDAIGSAIAAVLALEAMNKEVYGYCPGPYLSHFLDLPHIDKLHTAPPENRPFDLTLVLDCGDLQRVTPDFKPIGYVVNVDHHGTNPLFGDLNWLNPGASATGELVFAILHALKVRFTSGMANALYLAIMTDTGSYRYGNSSPDAFHLSGLLVQLGANPQETARIYWESNSPESTRLRGLALANMQLHGEGRIAWSQLTTAEIASHGGMVNEPEGLSGQLRAIRGVEVGILFTEVGAEGVRISLRSHGRCDVSEVARQFGGGGHRAAAGASVKMGLEQLKPLVLEALVNALAKANQ